MYLSQHATTPTSVVVTTISAHRWHQHHQQAHCKKITTTTTTTKNDNNNKKNKKNKKTMALLCAGESRQWDNCGTVWICIHACLCQLTIHFSQIWTVGELFPLFGIWFSVGDWVKDGEAEERSWLVNRTTNQTKRWAPIEQYSIAGQRRLS